jgi:hypothetical protein
MPIAARVAKQAQNGFGRARSQVSGQGRHGLRRAISLKVSIKTENTIAVEILLGYLEPSLPRPG